MFQYEYTDTFGGEANYSWVNRGYIPTEGKALTEAQIKRRAKKAVGLSGVRGRWEDFGDTFAFRPYGACVILFVSFDYGYIDGTWDAVQSHTSQ